MTANCLFLMLAAANAVSLAVSAAPSVLARLQASVVAARAGGAGQRLTQRLTHPIGAAPALDGMPAGAARSIDPASG